MDSRSNTSAILTSIQVNASVIINSVSETVNILTFGADFQKVILDSPSSFYAAIFRPDLASGDTAEAKVNGTGNPPRIIKYNQSDVTFEGIPAYSCAVTPWDNGYTASIGDIVIFEPATNVIPNQNQSVGNCAQISSTLMQSETCLRGAIRDIYRLKKRVDGLSNTDLSSLLTNDYSVTSGAILCASGGLALTSSLGTGRYKGQNFSISAGSFTPLTSKTLYRHIALINGTFESQAENATGGSIDAIYNPSGASPLPSAASPVWTAAGTASVESVANSVLTFSTSSNTKTYTRASTAGPPASGSTFDAIVQWSSGSDTNRIEIDDGTNREELIINEKNIKLVSTGDTYPVDCTEWVHIRLTLQNGVAYVYLNGALVLASKITLASLSNRFRFGIHAGYSAGTPQAATGSFKIAYAKVIGSGALIPSFPNLTGVILGTSVTSDTGQVRPVSVQNKQGDIDRAFRREGRLAVLSDIKVVLPVGYYDARSLLWSDADTIIVPKGTRVKSSDGTTDIEVTANIEVKLSRTGVGGREEGSEANSQFYHIYLIAWLNATGLPIVTRECDMSDGTRVSAIASVKDLTSSGVLNLPGVYSKFRQIKNGAIYNNSSGNLDEFRKDNLSTEWTNPITILNSGTSTSFAAVSAAVAIPTTSRRGFFTARLVRVSTSSGEAQLTTREAGTTSGGAPRCAIVTNTNLPTNVDSNSFHERLSTTQQIEYVLTNPGTGSGNLYVNGFTDTEVK